MAGVAIAGLVGVLIANAVIGAFNDDTVRVVDVVESSAPSEVAPVAGDPPDGPADNDPSSGMRREPNAPAPRIVGSPADQSNNSNNSEFTNKTSNGETQPNTDTQNESDEESGSGDRYGAPPGRAPVGGADANDGDD